MTAATALALSSLYINGPKGVAKKRLVKEVNWFTIRSLILDGLVVEYNNRYYLTSVSDFEATEKFDEMLYIVGLAEKEMSLIPQGERRRNNGTLLRCLTKFVGSAILNS